VGRNYMCHLNTAALAISLAPNPTVFQKTLGLNDFYFGAEDSELPLGHIQMLGKTEGDILRPDAPALVPGFALDQVAKHAIDFWLISEDLPHPQNRVTVSQDDQIVLNYTPNNEEAHKRLNAKLHGLLGAIGCTGPLIPHSLYAAHELGIQAVAHQCGTMRFGTDPKASVLDLNCKAHDLDNLYVVDGSFFPSSAAVNPGLTIMANALRVGDHLAERLA
jgi:choline dehydrogenase-like flavoprotein